MMTVFSVFPVFLVITLMPSLDIFSFLIVTKSEYLKPVLHPTTNKSLTLSNLSFSDRSSAYIFLISSSVRYMLSLSFTVTLNPLYIKCMLFPLIVASFKKVLMVLILLPKRLWLFPFTFN